MEAAEVAVAAASSSAPREAVDVVAAVSTSAPRDRAKHAAKVKLPNPRKRLMTDGDFKVELAMQTRVPAPSFGPCALSVDLSLAELTRYEASSLDGPASWTLHAEPTVGVNIDLITPDSACVGAELAPEDVALLALVAPMMGGGRSKTEAKFDPKQVWLKNTVYLSNNLHEAVHAFGSDARARAEAVERMRDEDSSVDLAQKLLNVEASFVAARKPKESLRHATKTGVHAECVMTLLPDALLWANNYVQVCLADGDRAGYVSRKSLISQVVQTALKKRGHAVLSASLSNPSRKTPSPTAPDSEGDDKRRRIEFDCSRQYQLNFLEEGHSSGERVALFLDEQQGRATFCREMSKRVELTKCRTLTEARNDKETPVEPSWNGSTVIDFVPPGARAFGFDAADRNAFRAKLRPVSLDVSDDEEDDDDDDRDRDDHDDAANAPLDDQDEDHDL